jgi:hypothetical protein
MRWLNRTTTRWTVLWMTLVGFSIGSIYASVVGAALRGNL